MGGGDDVMDKVPVPFIQNLVEDVVREEGIENAKYAVTRGSAIGDNYVGVIYRVEITGKRKIRSYKDVAAGKKGNDKWSIIIKCMPEHKERRENAKKFFPNEVNVYNEIINYYLKFQEEKGVSVEDRFKSVAKCYKATSDGDNDVIILEDMRPKGFVMRERRIGLDAEHCCRVLRELGKYHAFSFALRDQRPEVFDNLKTFVKETIFDNSLNENENWLKYINHAKDTALKLIVKLTHENSVEHEILQRFCDNFQDDITLVTSGEEAEPHAVLSHGDCWTNNFLFKYNKDVPEEVCFLDFQLARYSSPVLDMSYLIYCCTTRQTRKESYNKMIDVYHDSLSRFLRLLGSDPDKLFPKSVLQDHLQKFSKFGLAMALMAMMLFTTDDAPNLDEIKTDDAPGDVIKRNDIYDERMGGVIFDMIEHGFIK